MFSHVVVCNFLLVFVHLSDKVIILNSSNRKRQSFFPRRYSNALEKIQLALIITDVLDIRRSVGIMITVHNKHFRLVILPSL